jgi:hypothetical protein
MILRPLWATATRFDATLAQRHVAWHVNGERESLYFQHSAF